MNRLTSMKRLATVAVIAVGIIVTAVAPGQAREGAEHGIAGGRPRAVEGHRRFEGHGGFEGHRHFDRNGHARVFLGVGPSFYWGSGYPYSYYPPAAVYSAPPAYWYYCPSAGAYYPNVPSCPEPWVPVPAM